MRYSVRTNVKSKMSQMERSEDSMETFAKNEQNHVFESILINSGKLIHKDRIFSNFGQSKGHVLI